MSVDIRVVREKDSITFEFSKAIGFDFFVISNAEERVFWELRPASMQPIEVSGASFFGVEVPPQVRREMDLVLQETSTASEAMENPRVTRIIYGEVPSGYREVVKASPLKRDEKYCAFLLGDGPEKAGEYFFV